MDAEIEAAIRGLGPLSQMPLGPAEGPLITQHEDEIAQAYLDAILAASPGVPPPGDRSRTCGWSTRLCTGSRAR